MKELNCARVGTLASAVAGTSLALKYVGNGCAPLSKAVTEFNCIWIGRLVALVPKYRSSTVVFLITSRCTPTDQEYTIGEILSGNRLPVIRRTSTGSVGGMKVVFMAPLARNCAVPAFARPVAGHHDGTTPNAPWQAVCGFRIAWNCGGWPLR